MSRKKTLIYSLIPTVVLFVSLELAARVGEHWRPPLPVDYGWGFDAESRLYVPSDAVPGLMITNPSKKVSFQDQQFQVPKPPGYVRVFVTGGSTILNAANALRNMAIELTMLLNPRKCQVIDAGGGGYGTHRLVAVVSEIMAYQPDVVVLSTGNNEFEEIEQMELAELKMLPLQKVLYKSALCRFIRDRIVGLEMDRRREEKNRDLLRTAPKWRDSAQNPFTEQEIDERMKEFRTYLTTIVQICQFNHVPLLFGTTPSNLFNPGLPPWSPALDRARKLYDSGQYEAGLAYVREQLRHSTRHQASDTENEIIRDVALKNNVPLADTEAAVIAAEPHHVPGETLMYDHCHFIESGSRLMCNVFKDAIIKIIQNNTP